MKKWTAVVGMVLVFGAARMLAQESYPLHPDTADGLPFGLIGTARATAGWI